MVRRGLPRRTRHANRTAAAPHRRAHSAHPTIAGESRAYSKQFKGSAAIQGLRPNADPSAGQFVIGLIIDEGGRQAAGKKADKAGQELRLKLKNKTERDQWVEALTMLLGAGGAAAKWKREQDAMSSPRELL